jgi:hypothetical protein
MPTADCIHAAATARFQKLVDAWLQSGAVREWAGPVGRLDAATHQFQPAADGSSDKDGGSSGSKAPRYVAAEGMAALAEHLASPVGPLCWRDLSWLSESAAGFRTWLLTNQPANPPNQPIHPDRPTDQGGSADPLMEVRRPMWVSRLTAVPGKGWQLTAANRSQGFFDAVVIAHNGKCANRLAAPAGAPAVARQLMRLRLNAVWALMVAFESPVAAPGGFEGGRGGWYYRYINPRGLQGAASCTLQERVPHTSTRLNALVTPHPPTHTPGAFISGSPTLSWASNNTAKLGVDHPGFPGLQCWTLFSTAEYGRWVGAFRLVVRHSLKPLPVKTQRTETHVTHTNQTPPGLTRCPRSLSPMQWPKGSRARCWQSLKRQ